MKQVVIIHGGNSFNSYRRYLEDLQSSTLDYDRLKLGSDWRSWLARSLPEADVLLPSLPNKQNAVYQEWQIYFEKILPFLNDQASLVGYSLGAMFLTKYLQANPLPKPVNQLCLLAGAYDDESEEDLGSFKVTGADKLPLSARQVHLFHSQDDPVVPFSELAKYQGDLPDAKSHIFTDRNHFFQEDFPELLKVLQQS